MNRQKRYGGDKERGRTEEQIIKALPFGSI
jgi:hypothetical protein